MKSNLRKLIKSYKVKSLANGWMQVEPQYIDEPIEEGATPIGVLTRLSVAAEIERILNDELKKK